MKLLAIDGNSIINRAFYGIKLLTTRDGRYTNAVYGFINILNRLLEAENPDCVAVAFDVKKPTFRHEKYDQYKAGRKGMPAELAEQMPVLKEWLRLAGYVSVECPGFEADDILGTLAGACEAGGDACVIATGDRDSLQLISDSTKVLLTATKMGRPEILHYDKAALFERYGLTPPEMIELKSLMGDSSDNIPGVPGVGEKTATALITEYHSLDRVYENLDTADMRESLKAKLIAGKESAYLSRELGTICRTAPIDTDVEHYKIGERKEAELAALMTGLEFFKLMEKMGIAPGVVPLPKEQETLRFTVCQPFAPTESADLYFAGDRAAVVSKGKVFSCDQEALAAYLADPALKKRVYDYKNLCKRFSPVNAVVFDGMLAAYLCNPSASSYEIDRIMGEYASAVPLPEGEPDEICREACRFSVALDGLEAELKKTEQFQLLTEIELPLARVLAAMEQDGFSVDRAGLSALSEELASRIRVIEDEIYSLVGYEFNLNSPKQLGVALFEKLGLPAKKKTKSGYSTNAEVLEELKYAHPAVEKLLEYRQLAKLKSTYADGLQECIAADGRIHTTFNQTETRTGRISSLEPNLQNIPVRSGEGRRLRGYFTAPAGKTLCDADYSQIELRVLASLASDQNMIEAFNNGVDIHTVTASQVFGLPEEMITPELRSRAKAVNFGIVYGIGAFSLAKDIGVTRAEAARYIEKYLGTFSGVATFMDRVIEEAKANGFVTTLFGRRRYLPELASSNHMLRAFGERVARNAPIQGTAADIIKIAMIRVFDRLEKEYPTARLILQVHDELIVECEEKDSRAVCDVLEEEMENAVRMAVTLTAEAHAGKTWLEAKA